MFKYVKNNIGLAPITALIALSVMILAGTAYFIFEKPQTATANNLTTDQIKTAQYTLPDFGGPFVFNANGEATTSILEGKGGAATGVTATANLISDKAALGDLNGDGKGDAVAAAVEQLGGSGSFYYLVAFLNANGQPQEAATELLGDRIIINAIAIQGGQITVDMLDHGPNDGMARATMPVTLHFKLQNGKFVDTDVQSYTSQKLGISFNYFTGVDKSGDNQTGVKVLEEGDKIYVYLPYDKPEQGQSVEVFAKDPKDTLSEAITKKFLGGISPKDCFVEAVHGAISVLPASSSLVAAIINYPPPSSPDAPFWQNSDKCPAGYSATNGISYFLMDKNHPDRFMYLNIGQYAILGDGNGDTWQQTIRVLPLSN